MSLVRDLGQDVYYVGASDMRLSRFENMIPLNNGVSYNSFLIRDEKTCLMDTVDSSILLQFLESVEVALNGRDLDYIVIQHMEPDHCSGVIQLMQRYPNCQIVGNAKTFQFLKQFRGENFPERQLLIAEGDRLNLGQHELEFVMAPLVHWPEVFFTYDHHAQILFSADAFGSFNYISGNIWSDEVNYDEYWLPEARRYYLNIVGKQGPSVQKVLNKLSPYNIKRIYPLHGVLHREQKITQKMLSYYQTWSSYQPEEKGLVIVYASMYGGMEECCLRLANLLADRGVKGIRFYDVSHSDETYIISDLFRYSNMVFGVVNHNTNLYHKMADFIHFMQCENLQNRPFGLLVSKSWGGQAGKQALEGLLACKGCEQVGETFEILSTFNESQQADLEKLADCLAESYRNAKVMMEH